MTTANEQTQAVAPRRQADVIERVFTADRIAQAKQYVPSHVPVERIKIAFRACAIRNPGLLECKPESISLAFIKCAQAGVIPDGRQAHLIPFGKDVQVVFDYKGIADLVRRSGEVRSIHADVVYDGDKFVVSHGTGAKLVHEPMLRGDRGEVYAVYSFVELKDGSGDYHVMTVDDINDVRDNHSMGYRKAKEKGNDHPWISCWNEMAKKTVFRAHSKWLPLSPDLVNKLAMDDDGRQKDDVVEIMTSIQDPARQVEAPRFAKRANAAPVDGPSESETPEPDPATTATQTRTQAPTPHGPTTVKEVEKEINTDDVQRLVGILQEKIKTEGVEAEKVYAFLVRRKKVPAGMGDWAELTVDQLNIAINLVDVAAENIRIEAKNA